MSTLDARKTARFKTFPAPGVGTAFRLAIGSCNNWNTGLSTPSLPAICQLSPLPDLFIHLGDNGYPEYTEDDITLQLKFGIDYTNRRSAVRDLNRLMPTMYMPQDHDGSLNEGNLWVFGTDAASKAKHRGIIANTLQVYKAMVPHYPLRNSNLFAQSFQIGRWAFIGVDTQGQSRFGRTKGGLPPAADRYVIGSTDPDCFYNQLDDIKTQMAAAEASGDVDVIVLLFPMGYHDPVYQTGFFYYAPTEKTALEDWVVANITKQVIVLTGDLHAMGIDDGTVTDTSTSGTGEIITILSSGLLAGASPAPRSYTFAGREGFIAGNSRAFAVLDVASDSSWEVNFYGEPYDGTVPTLLGTYASSEL